MFCTKCNSFTFNMQAITETHVFCKPKIGVQILEQSGQDLAKQGYFVPRKDGDKTLSRHYICLLSKICK